MKLLVALLVGGFARISLCFLQYPFASDLLDSLLSTLNCGNDKIEENLMENAIDGEKCFRECSAHDRRVCYFNFSLRHYQVMGGECRHCKDKNVEDCLNERCVIADGVSRGYLAINFQLPAPKIQVCKNDIVVVDLKNDAEGYATSIHWHGMRQKGTQSMDGVPYLTQCPIPYGKIFRYTFRAEDEGTHFYHSHSSHQKADGVAGPLIVRGVEKENPNRHTYDYDLPDHTIFMNDWLHQSAEDFMPGLNKRSSLSKSILINGHGTFFNETTNETSFAPLTVFHVEAGSRYRFRLINSAINVCSFLFQIEDHDFTIISTEVSYVKPIVINTLYFMAGERYDFVIDTKGKPIRDYFIRIKQLIPCHQKLQGFAVLRYHKNIETGNMKKKEFYGRSTPKFDNEYPNGTLLNSNLPGEKDLAITILEDFRYDPKLVENPADKTEYLFFDTPNIPNNAIYQKEMMERFLFTTSGIGISFMGTANNISFKMPSFPLLLNPEQVHEDMFCDGKTLDISKCPKFLGKPVCRCIHRIRFELNSIAELILVNVDDRLTHPMHLHGHKFHVMDMGMLKENMTVSEVLNGAIPKRNAKKPPYKDTVIFPWPGYVRLRFRADNPGYWLFHCHFDFHLLVGMALMVQVGEVHEMKKPPENFPQCQDYTPDKIV